MSDNSWASLFNGPALDILYLSLCWALTLTTSTLLTTIGPLSAKHVGASNVMAPFTIGAFLFGAAFSSVPSGPLFRKYGRLKGFSVGCMCQVMGSIIGAGGMIFESVYLVFVGCFFVGLSQGLGQFYRFTAVEIAPPNLKSQSITYVLSGGVIAAFLGPTTANYSVDLLSRPYLGSFMMMSVIGILNQLCCMLVRFAPQENVYEKLVKTPDNGEEEENLVRPDSPGNSNNQSVTSLIPVTNRPIMEIISQPLFIVSCAVATLAHTIMIMVMSNTSLAMIDTYGYNFNDSARMMELHFACMFGPGFFTGKLIVAYGSFLVAMLGAVTFACSSFVFLAGTELWNFYVGMALLGIAWNFSFSAGTVMLTGSYKKSEATDVQAVNDFILFTVAGTGSLISGVIFSSSDWNVLIYVVSGMMVFNIVLFAASWRIKAQIEESIRIAEMEDEGGNEVFSPVHAGGVGAVSPKKRSISSASSATRGLYQDREHERLNRLSRNSRQNSRDIHAGVPVFTQNYRGVSFTDAFIPAPMDDDDDRIRLNSFTPV